MRARYHMPPGLDDVLALLAEHREKALIVAGGTVATPKLRGSLPAPEHVIDIARVAQLNYIDNSKSGRLAVGALATCADLVASPVVQSCAPVLSQAASSVGGPQIRNVATLGGNIATRCPRADLLPVLLALDCVVTLQSALNGRRNIALSEYLAATPRSHELLTGVECDAAPRGAAFVRLAARRSLSPAIASVATFLATRNGTWTSVRIALGGVASTAVRASAAERALAASGADFAAGARLASQAASAAADPKSDALASAAYRRTLVGILTHRALVAANAQAAGA
jgi:carbon-monoxide dehydrogenase medium subunit